MIYQLPEINSSFDSVPIQPLQTGLEYFQLQSPTKNASKHIQHIFHAYL